MIAGRSTGFYDRIYSSGLINDTFEYEYSAERDFAFTLFGGESPEPEKASEEIFKELAKIKEKGLDKVSFERVRRAHMGHFIRSFNSIDFIARNFVHAQFNGAGLLDYVDIYDRINIDFVFDVFKNMFNPDKSAISVVEPT
jgi:predicted Zn-dependent peptidase